MAQAMYHNELPGDSLFRSRVRWGAILAGVIAGMIVQAILTLLGLAIGLQAADPADPTYNWTGLGTGSGFWLLLSAIASGFAGGWVASSLANIGSRFDGLAHGILSWGVFMVIAAYLMGSGMGAVLGGAFNMTSSVLSGASQGLAMDDQNRQQGVAMIREQMTNQQQQQQQANQQQAAPTNEEITRAEQSADAAAGVTWGAFIIALLSLGASALGGVMGLKNHYVRTSTTV